MHEQTIGREIAPGKASPVDTAWPIMPLAAWQPMLDAVNAWNGNVGATMAKAGYEWVDFVNRRLTQDIALGQRLTACGGTDEAWQIYTEFYQKAVEDYQKELMHFAKLGGDLAEKSARAAGRTSGQLDRPSKVACP